MSALARGMIYYLFDRRYLRMTYTAGFWTDPNADEQDSGTARVLRQWSDQMLQVEQNEPDDQALGETAQRVCIDFFTNSVLVFVDEDEEALVWSITKNRKAWSDKQAGDIARARIVALASLHAKLCKTNQRRVVELWFLTTLRGPVCPFPSDHAPSEEAETRRRQWLDAMNEFDLGVVVHFLFRPPAYSSYLPHDRFDKLLEVLKESVEAHSQCEGPMGLTHNPNSPPAPGATAPPSPDEDGPVRKHDKGPRATKWAGPRPRPGGLSSGSAGANATRPCFPRSSVHDQTGAAACMQRGVREARLLHTAARNARRRRRP